jgi:hypothetical protein
VPVAGVELGSWAAAAVGQAGEVGQHVGHGQLGNDLPVEVLRVRKRECDAS